MSKQGMFSLHEPITALANGQPGNKSPMSTALVENLAALREKIVRLALQEWLRWNKGKIKDDDPKIRTVLADYWHRGLGRQHDEPWRWLQYPWSAVFISWVMRKAGAGNAFHYSADHANYLLAARRNRLLGNSNPFKAYRIQEMHPQPGDVVCRRSGGRAVTYKNLQPGDKKIHCEIVTAVRPGQYIAIGGDLKNAVSLASIRSDPNGYITDPGFFAIVALEAHSP